MEQNYLEWKVKRPDSGVRLVHPPVGTYRVTVLSSHLAKQWKEALHLAVT